MYDQFWLLRHLSFYLVHDCALYYLAGILHTELVLLVIIWLKNNISSCYYSCLSGIVKRRTGNGQFTCGPRLTGKYSQVRVDSMQVRDRWKRVFLQHPIPLRHRSFFIPTFLPPVSCILAYRSAVHFRRSVVVVRWFVVNPLSCR